MFNNYVQLYSKNKMPRNFTLGGDPYTSEAAREKLKELGVAFWRDQNHPDGVLIEVIKGRAFFSQFFVEKTDFSVYKWKTPPKAHVKRWPNDNFAWTHYNKQVVIGHMSEELVQRV